MKHLHHWTSGFGLAILVFTSMTAAAEPVLRRGANYEEGQTPAKPATEKLSPAALLEWSQVVRDLDDDDYPTREQASQKLARAGAPVVPLLCQAVQAGSPEVVWRGTKALEQIAIRGDEAAIEAVVFAVQELSKQARPELAGMAAGLRERQRWFRHQSALKRLRQSGAEVATTGEDGEIAEEAVMAFGGFGGGFIAGPIGIDVDEVEMEIAEGPVVAAEWEGPAEVMTLEDRLAMYDPIEVTFLDQFKEQAAKATALPGALEGWEDVTVDDVAMLDADPAAAEGFAAEEFAAEEIPEAMPAAAVARALERIAILEREVAEGVEAEGELVPVDIEEPAMEAAEVILAEADFAPAGFFVEEIGVHGEGGAQSTATIDSNWKGGNDGLKDLAALEGPVTLTLRDAPLTDDALQHIAAVKNLASLAVFGGKLSAESLLKFHREYPKVQISARSNGWMGINAFGTPCQVENIVDNSAAEQAGLKVGDVVLKINGAEIKDFTELTLAMVSQGAGDVVRVSIERDGKTLEIPVKLHPRP